jgi:hypothetical protein
MGPWGFVLAKDRAAAEAVALVRYQGRPTYHAIILFFAERLKTTWARQDWMFSACLMPKRHYPP